MPPPRTSISKRVQALLLGAFVLACATYLAVRFWPRDRVQELLEEMPAAAIVAYIDVPGLTAAATDASLELPWSFGLGPSRLQGISLALTAEHEFYAAAGGDFSASLIDALLASQGVRCAASVGVSPCAADLGHGPVLVRVVRSGTLVATTANALDAPRTITFRGEEVRAALSGGAVVWAAIDPQLLDAAMEDPPAEWLNLQIFARALETARMAYLTVHPLTGTDVSLRIEAHCDAADSEQLERVLTGLNDMTLALLSRDAAAAGQWAPILESFKGSRAAETVRVQWTLPAQRLADLWRPTD